MKNNIANKGIYLNKKNKIFFILGYYYKNIFLLIDNYINKILIYRPPASGKGTQCKLIANKFSMLHISAGDCLREELEKKDSFYKDLIIKYMKDGKIVPVQITCSLLRNKMYNSDNVI